MAKAIDLTGQKINRLTVLERESERKSFHIQWLCQCECGNTVSVRSQHLREGKVKSCGCLNSEKVIARNKTGRLGHKHGFAPNGDQHYLYSTWSNIIQRCCNENSSNYPWYGARGISVYEHWRTNPALFIEWILKNLGERPEKYSLDRINNDGNYEPGNLRWADRGTQSRNQRPKPKGYKISREKVERNAKKRMLQNPLYGTESLNLIKQGIAASKSWPMISKELFAIGIQTKKGNMLDPSSLRQAAIRMKFWKR